MNNANMIEVFDAVTGGIDGSASVDDWRTMSVDELRETADGMADNYYEPLGTEELGLVVDAITQAQGADSGLAFHTARNSLDEE